MEVIVNEVELKKQAREKERFERLKKEGKQPEEKKEEKKEVVICRTTTDVVKRKLDRLMKDPSKDVYIPEKRKEWKPRDAPEFVRHVMGSSAGAGSGEFHVYRGIRKRERIRQEYLEKKSVKTDLEEQFQNKMTENKEKADAMTAKKRAKRLKKKQKKLMEKKLKKTEKDDPEIPSADKDESTDESEKEENEAEEDEEPHFQIGGK